MNGRSGVLPPSPPHSIVRSSNGTGLYPMNGASGRKYSSSMFEEQLAEHHRVLKDYLGAGGGHDGLYPRPNRARDKLQRLSPIQFQELSTDVYDELLRREDERHAEENPGSFQGQVPRFLLPKNNFHPKRNQARQKLSTLAVQKFRELSTDVLFELERRYPSFTGEIGDAASPAESAASSMRAPSRGPRSRSGTGVSINTGPFQPGMRRPSLASQAPYSPGIFEEGGRATPISASGNDYGRPLQRTFHSSTMVPNKSTMVEDDGDQSGDEDGDAFDLEGVGTRSSRRTTNKSLPYSVGEPRFTIDYQSQISQLEQKLGELEGQLKEKDEEVQRSATGAKEKDQALDAEKIKFSNLKSDLERQLQSAENLNSSLKTELEKVKASNESLKNEMLAASGQDEWKTRYEQLEKEFHDQQQMTDEVRQEAMQALSEMRMLSERYAEKSEHEETLEVQVSRLEDEVSEWKSRYARTKTQLRSLRASSIGLSIEQPSAGEHAKVGAFITPDGLIKDVSVTKFQIAVDELLHLLRTGEPTAVLGHMRTIVACVRSVTEDIDAASATSPEDVAKKRAKLKSRVSAAANGLITASKNFSASEGLAPVSLVDAAASNLTAAVVELIKTVKIRPTPAGELEDDDDGNLPPETSGNVPFPTRTTSHRGNRLRVTGPDYDGTRNIDGGSHAQTTVQQKQPQRGSLRRASSSRSQEVQPSTASLVSSYAGSGNDEDPNVDEHALSNYLAQQTDSLVSSIRPLIARIRGNAAAASDGSDSSKAVNSHVSSVAVTISFVIERISSEVEEGGAQGESADEADEHAAIAAALEKHAYPLLAELQQCRADLLQAQKQFREMDAQGTAPADAAAHLDGRVGPLAKRIVQAMKTLVEKVEQIERGQLSARDAVDDR